MTPEINIIAASQNGDEGQQNYFLSPTKRDPNRSRASSVTPSERSERSRITLVEEDVDITSPEATEDPQGVLEIKISPPKLRWVEHVLGVCCIRLPRRKRMEVIEKTFIPNTKLEPPSSESPWIISVFVLSHHAVQEHHTQKRAQCTIDTGNHQGNVVSRDFLINELGYPEHEFLELTNEEKKGGISATDTRLIPQGAVYLDWYYSRSPHVFRKMRFLVSPHSFCDLIIGARSIEKHSILGVPFLALNDAQDIQVIKDPKSANVSQLIAEIGEVKNTITTDQRRLKTIAGTAKDKLEKTTACNRMRLEVLEKGLAYRRAQEALAREKKVKNAQVEKLKELDDNVEKAEKELAAAEDKVREAKSSEIVVDKAL